MVRSVRITGTDMSPSSTILFNLDDDDKKKNKE